MEQHKFKGGDGELEIFQNGSAVQQRLLSSFESQITLLR